MPKVLRSKRSPVQIGAGVFRKSYGLLSLGNGVDDSYRQGFLWRVQFYPAVS